jgi:hypothetical protein
MSKKAVHLDPKELERLYYKERLGIDAIATRLNTSHGSVWRAMEEYGIARRDLSQAEIKHHRTSFTGDLYQKAYLIGLRLGDLWVHMDKPGVGSKTIVVSCHSTSQDQLALVQSLFEPYGHVQTTTYADGSAQVLCYLDNTFEFLLPKEDNIPPWILESEDYFVAFLAGYVDAEGSFCVPRTGRAQFQLKSCDVNILFQIHTFLTRHLNVDCSPPRQVQERGAPTGKGYRLQQDVWLLSIGSKRALYRLSRLLEPYIKHAKRKHDLYAVLDNVMQRGID